MTAPYPVQKTQAPIQLTGCGTDPAWQQAQQLSDFHYPWRDQAPPPTHFKALWDETHFYFLFRAIDPDMPHKQKSLPNRPILNADRVEIFFKAASDQRPYYSLEMDATGRLLDTEGRFGQTIDFDWQWPAGQLTFLASIDEAGYWVEGAIRWASLRELGVYQDDQILRAGLYRGEYVEDGQAGWGPKWISWISPDSATPNFHIPSSFGLLQLYP